MLYLIRTFGRTKNKRGLKVGFSDNLNKRLRQYRTENPYFELVTTREGTRMEEAKMHLYLTSLGLKEGYLMEWFKDCQETLTEFHVKPEKRDRMIWRKRGMLFDRSDFTRENIKLKIYEELRLLHNGEKMELGIDKEWKKYSNLKYLKSHPVIEE